MTLTKRITNILTLVILSNLFISSSNTAYNYPSSSTCTQPKRNWLAAAVTTGLLAIGSYAAHKFYKMTKTEKFEEQYPKTKYYVETYAPIAAAVAIIGGLIYAPLQLAKWHFMDRIEAQMTSTMLAMATAQAVPTFLMMSALNKMALPDEHRSTVTLKDYAGAPDPAILEVIDYLKNPAIREDYKKNKLPLPKGILLYGPPGTGKTYLARAISGEANIPFFAVSAADINQALVGQTEKVIKGIFKKAKDAAIFNEAKTAIIFIDEIDSIAGKRSNSKSDYHRSLLGTLLSEMDGIKPNNNVLVLACTNMPQDLDPAIKREGRFDQLIILDLPNAEQRKQLIEFYLSKAPYQHKHNDKERENFISEMTRMTNGMAAATLKGIIDDATRAAIHKKNKENAREVVVTDHLIKEVIRQKVKKQHAIKNQHALDEKEIKIAADI